MAVGKQAERIGLTPESRATPRRLRGICLPVMVWLLPRCWGPACTRRPIEFHLVPTKALASAVVHILSTACLTDLLDPDLALGTKPQNCGLEEFVLRGVGEDSVSMAHVDIEHVKACIGPHDRAIAARDRVL